VGGDFFTQVPTGGDAYILSWVIHDWGDVDATNILSACRRAMGEQAKLLLVEGIVERGSLQH
jgi:hypothetical protein